VATIVKTTAATAVPVATAPMTVVVLVLAAVVLVAQVLVVAPPAVTLVLLPPQLTAATSLPCLLVPLMPRVPSVFARPPWPKRKENKHVAT